MQNRKIFFARREILRFLKRKKNHFYSQINKTLVNIFLGYFWIFLRKIFETLKIQRFFFNVEVFLRFPCSRHCNDEKKSIFSINMRFSFSKNDLRIHSFYNNFTRISIKIIRILQMTKTNFYSFWFVSCILISLIEHIIHNIICSLEIFPLTSFIIRYW